MPSALLNDFTAVLLCPPPNHTGWGFCGTHGPWRHVIAHQLFAFPVQPVNFHSPFLLTWCSSLSVSCAGHLLNTDRAQSCGQGKQQKVKGPVLVQPAAWPGTSQSPPCCWRFGTCSYWVHPSLVNSHHILICLLSLILTELWPHAGPWASATEGEGRSLAFGAVSIRGSGVRAEVAVDCPHGAQAPLSPEEGHKVSVSFRQTGRWTGTPSSAGFFLPALPSLHPIQEMKASFQFSFKFISLNIDMWPCLKCPEPTFKLNDLKER